MTRVRVFPAVVLALLATVASHGVETVETTVAEVATVIPEEVRWSPRGGSVWVSTVNDDLDISTVTRFPVGEGERRDFTLQGTVRAFRVSPDERFVATIREKEARVLDIWDSAGEKPVEVFRDRWNLYFPLVNTIDPWQPSGEHLVFYRAWLHERKLMLWEAATGEVREVTEERRSDRAFWNRRGDLLVPQGVPFEVLLAGGADPVLGIVEIDVAGGREEFRPIPGGFRTIFPFSSLDIAILKDEVSAPLALNLDTWRTTPLPGTVERFLDLAWSPDGSRVAYPVMGQVANRILCYDLEKRDTRLVWVSDLDLAGSVDWSPSGRYLAVVLLDLSTKSRARAEVLDLSSNETVWSRERDAGFVQRYMRRGRRSLLWHPKEDRLLLWDRVDREDGSAGVELQTVEFREGEDSR